MRLPILLSLLAAAATASIASPVRAQSEEELARARALFVEGAKLAESGSWEAARDRFEKSSKIKRAPLTVYNLGIAQQETGKILDAIESYKAFLAMPVEPATQSYVAPVRAVLAKLETRVGLIALDVRPAGLAGLVVRIDGREVAAETGPWRVDPGPHEIVAVAPGLGELKQTAHVPEGARTSVALTLVVPAPVEPPRPPSVALPAGLAIGGLVLLAGGEATFAVGAAGASASRSTNRTMMIAGNAVAGAGAVAIGIGLVLLLRQKPARAPSAAALHAPWLTADLDGVTLRF
jgi:hypothetical protein